MSDAGPSQEGEEPPETACAKLRRLCNARSLSIVMIAVAVLIALVYFIAVLTFLIPCKKSLVIQLKDFAVRDMVMVHSNSTSWQVTSDIDLTLAFHNPNSWARPCDFSLLEVELSVRYRDNLISIYDLVYPLRSLKPSSSHKVSTTLTGDRSHVSDDAGVALEAQLLRNDNVTFVLDINARYLVPGWNRLLNHKICEVVASTPQQASMRSGDKSFLSAECKEKVIEEP